MPGDLATVHGGGESVATTLLPGEAASGHADPPAPASAGRHKRPLVDTLTTLGKLLYCVTNVVLVASLIYLVCKHDDEIRTLNNQIMHLRSKLQQVIAADGLDGLDRGYDDSDLLPAPQAQVDSNNAWPQNETVSAMHSMHAIIIT